MVKNKIFLLACNFCGILQIYDRHKMELITASLQIDIHENNFIRLG